ncbi:MAG: alpha-amylase family glycosyl hydrolase [Anaerolineales bacterium]
MKTQGFKTVTLKITMVFLLLSGFLGIVEAPQAVKATAAWMWHGGNIVAGGVATDNPLPGQDVEIWLKVGYDGWVNQARIYYTTDGTEPQGSYDSVTNGHLVQMTFSHTEADSGGTVAWWRGTLPAQSQGTHVQYKIAAWHSGGGSLVYAESVEGKTLYTSAEATNFGYYVAAYESPDWARDAIIYQVFIDRFFDGNINNNYDCVTESSGYCQYDLFDWNGGDLAGAAESLDYLQYMGVNTLWLSPVYENPASQIGSVYDSNPGVVRNYHGYEARSFTAIEENFGLDQDLEQLIDAAHDAGMRVILDFVPNHSSNQHPYFKDASDNCTTSPYYRWYKFGTTNSSGHIVSYDDSLCVAGHTDWWGDNDSYANFFGVKEMPQIDNDYGPARAATIDQALMWVNDYDIDGLRLDYAPGPNRSFWLAFRAAVKAADPTIYLVGEVWTDGGAAERKSYEGELDGVLSFDHNDLFLGFFAHRTNNVDGFDGGLNYFADYYDSEYVLPTFLDNHDKDRFLFEAGQNIDRLELAFVSQFTLEQPPVIYYGTEVGLTQYEASAGKPERSRARMLWGNYMSNPPAGWDAGQNVGLRELVRSLIGLRNDYSALRTGERVTLYLHNDDGTYAYRRTDADANVVVALNNSDYSRSMTIPNQPGASLGWADGTTVRDELSGATYTVSNGQISVSLSPLQGMVLVLDEGPSCEFNFTVNGYVTSYGQDMYVVGNVSELGNWSPSSAAPLSWVDSDTWSGSVSFSSSCGQGIEYKYIVIENGNVTWEPGSNNTTTLPTSGSGSVVDVWGP